MTNLRTWILLAAAVLLMAGTVGAQTVTANKGIFGRGHLHGGVKGGWVSTTGDDYLMLGLGLGYNVADGVTAGLDYETWLLGEPTVHKLAPWIGYTYWQAPKVKPYVAAFYRQNWVSGYDDYQDVGGRIGVFMPRGRSYLGFGMVYEYRLDDDSDDRDRWYPEVRFAIGL